jgi:chondroitin 4-sulfotransferase 11
MSVFNRDYNVIFIHVPKTAGTSMERREFLGSGGHQTVHHFRDQEGFADAFTFAFVRNPWERYVSAWSQMNEGRPSEIVITAPVVHFRPQHEFICDENGEILVDFVGRYENLLVDWAYVCATLGVSAELAHHRPGKHGPYHAYYTPETWEQLSAMYARDIEIFGYGDEYMEVRRE